MEKARAVNLYQEEYDVYIGRGEGLKGKWGNPYSHKENTLAQFKTSSREEAVDKYKHYLWQKIKSGEISVEELAFLHGKKLGCFCKPKACHGDILAKAAEWAYQKTSNPSS